MITGNQIPRMIENTVTGATILFGRSPYNEQTIRYVTECACGSHRLELIAPPDVDPEDYLWAAREQHLEHFPDCECMETRDLTAYRN